MSRTPLATTAHAAKSFSLIYLLVIGFFFLRVRSKSSMKNPIWEIVYNIHVHINTNVERWCEVCLVVNCISKSHHSYTYMYYTIVFPNIIIIGRCRHAFKFICLYEKKIKSKCPMNNFQSATVRAVVCSSSPYIQSKRAFSSVIHKARCRI